MSSPLTEGTQKRLWDRSCLRELDRLGKDLAVLDREIAVTALDDGAVKRLMTITGVELTVAASLMAAIGDIHRFSAWATGPTLDLFSATGTRRSVLPTQDE